MTYLLALFGILAISFSAILVRLSGASPSTAAFYRCAYAVPVLVVAWLLVRNRDRRSTTERWLALAAGGFFALDLTLWHRSIEDIGAGMSTVLGNTQILFVGVLAWLLFRERPTRTALVLVPVILAGVALSTGLGAEDSFGVNPVRGAVYGVFTGIAYAFFLLTFRRANRSLAPPAGPLLDATAGATVGILILAPFDRHFDLGPPLESHLWLIVLALGVQVAGWLLISVALPRLPSLETSVMLLLQPMAALLWGFLIYSEEPSPVQWAGVAVVLVGVGILSWRGSVEGERIDGPLDAPPPAESAAV
ncbi:MAG TPA: DMT family transporter [Actinomycetota bacterium]|nr:DMT family transporter [Actinomycetota bacterium]